MRLNKEYCNGTKDFNKKEFLITRIFVPIISFLAFTGLIYLYANNYVTDTQYAFVYVLIVAILAFDTVVFYGVIPYIRRTRCFTLAYDANEEYANENKPNPINRERNRKARKKKRKLKERKRG